MNRGDKDPGVLLVGNFLSASGKNPQVSEQMAAALRARGWPVVTTSTQTNRVARMADMVATAWRRRHDYSVAHVDVFSGPSFIWAEAVSGVLRSLGKPYVLTLRGGSLPEFARNSPTRVRSVLTAAAVVTTPSRYLAEHMAPYCPELILIPNPIDLGRYPDRKREKFQPSLVWLRAFHHIYNPTLGPRVVALLRPTFPDVTLTMIGPDKGDGSLQEVQAVAHELDVADRLTLPGRVEKTLVPEWLGHHDVFINTTNVDNTPVSVIEAMACGLCVVSTDVGGIPYFLDHEVDSLLVPPDDASAMADAVGRILTEDGLAARLSRKGRTKAETCDWSRVLPRWERLFSGLG